MTARKEWHYITRTDIEEKYLKYLTGIGKVEHGCSGIFGTRAFFGEKSEGLDFSKKETAQEFARIVCELDSRVATDSICIESYREKSSDQVAKK